MKRHLQQKRKQLDILILVLMIQIPLSHPKEVCMQGEVKKVGQDARLKEPIK